MPVNIIYHAQQQSVTCYLGMHTGVSITCGTTCLTSLAVASRHDLIHSTKPSLTPYNNITLPLRSFCAYFRICSDSKRLIEMVIRHAKVVPWS